MPRSRICAFELDPRGFVRATVDPLAEMTLEDAREALAFTAKVAGERRPVLVDLREIKSQTREVRDYFAGHEDVVAACSRVAVLVASPVSRVIGNFFVKTTVQKMPNRLFTDEASAVNWLLEGG